MSRSQTITPSLRAAYQAARREAATPRAFTIAGVDLLVGDGAPAGAAAVHLRSSPSPVSFDRRQQLPLRKVFEGWWPAARACEIDVLELSATAGAYGLLAARLGARRVTLVGDSIETARVLSENAARNGLAAQVRTRLPAAPARFDLVVVDCCACPAPARLRSAAGRLRPGGALLVHGYPRSFEDAVRGCHPGPWHMGWADESCFALAMTAQNGGR
jgi:SAM-dependent methyltransferase